MANDRKRSVWLSIISFAAIAALIFGVSGCLQDGEGADSSQPKSNKNEDGTYFDNGETFCRGVWAADDGEKRVGYYIFYDGENGRFSDAQYGMGVPFRVTVKKDSVDFCLGAADFSDPTTVEIAGDAKRELTWTNENRVENLTLLPDQEPDTFEFYSQNDLGEMAKDYYETQNAVRPEVAGTNIAVDGMVSIQLYGKDGNLIVEYSVDSITGRGTVKDSGEEITLIRMTTDD